jgi:putative hydrolases of HD superfamily
MVSNHSNEKIVNLLNEIGMLAHIPRSGFAFLGSGRQSVAEHSYRMTLVAYALACLIDEPVNMYKLIMMCLFHDLPEARIGDLNYVQKKYVAPKLDKALDDIASGSFLGPEIVAWIQEYEQGTSLEAQLAHDADQLELILVLKREQELGNPQASAWIENTLKRLKTEAGKKIGETICLTPSDNWWLEDKKDPHWINGGKEANQ